MASYSHLVRPWIAIAIVVTALSLFMYGRQFHALRSAADDPQVELAQDAARRLGAGAEVRDVVPPVAVKVEESSDLFFIVYAPDGKVLGSSVQIDSNTPTLPEGTLTTLTAQKNFTWEPKEGVRIAAVIVPYIGSNSGFVLAGRSLQETEEQTATLARNIGFTWILFLVGGMAGLLVLKKNKK